MELKYGQQISYSDIEILECIDLIIYTKNHELRSSYFVDKIKIKNPNIETISLLYKPKKRFKKNEYYIDSNDKIIELLDQFFNRLSPSEKSINIIVDYSCMTKSWYYLILQYILNKDLIVENLSMFFTYTPAYYTIPKPPKHNSEIGPLPGKIIIPNNKPNALIVCLGYEENKAEGIIDHLDPKLYFLLYSSPSLDTRFVDVLEKNNKTVLNSTTNVIKFPFNDLLFIERELTSLYHFLRDDYNIIIAPLGPKPFTLTSMLLSVKYPEIDIWRVGSGNDINEYRQLPMEDKEIIMKVSFEK
ncbi:MULTISPECIES: hypothetical protein [Sphingobacterium]|uniref:hypothetical protein n=1 Tax=Sphingobacterium TaxID=28453 RepID=UPI0008A24E73|nr:MULTISPECIES: hypothetical protein [Sphingobacterium]OFV12857.1 hypothetical protein HMPREF3127_15905 [Sphingobacterium sp. HMSC13C05]